MIRKRKNSVSPVLGNNLEGDRDEFLDEEIKIKITHNIPWASIDRFNELMRRYIKINLPVEIRSHRRRGDNSKFINLFYCRDHKRIYYEKKPGCTNLNEFIFNDIASSIEKV